MMVGLGPQWRHVHRPGNPDLSAEWVEDLGRGFLPWVVCRDDQLYRMRGQMPEPDMTLGRTHMWRQSKIIAWYK